MPEFEGYKIVYEVIALPKGKWSILVEIIHRQDGGVLAPRHNPFPNHPFDTKLEALDQVNQYIETVLAEAGTEAKQRRVA
ncbi:hypothetical protein [Cupriavidus numazuensis]|uniref:Uncharacterized protein n=1 Tax=Cupriavidus numazuensis TaxID=221992 RepID=A0ABN7Q1M4_9BURK|nr:hypothetical protein [Cupriavidus numazuensis]CAG2143690.1 hypothetical protein LMG26411_02428 [Cupriavidus numazuensis]